MENEIMNEGMEVFEDVVADKAPGMGAGAVVAIVAAGALAVGAGVVAVRKAIKAWKAKKEAAKQHDFVDIDVDAEDVTE